MVILTTKRCYDSRMCVILLVFPFVLQNILPSLSEQKVLGLILSVLHSLKCVTYWRSVTPRDEALMMIPAVSLNSGGGRRLDAEHADV